MQEAADSTSYPYRELADRLVEYLGNSLSVRELADRLRVSPPSVSNWFSGKCRPRPRRIGAMAAMLTLEEGDLEELTYLAGYTYDQHIQALEAYMEWSMAHERWQLARSVRRHFTDWALQQFRSDHDLRKRLEREDEELFKAVEKAFQ